MQLAGRASMLTRICRPHRTLVPSVRLYATTAYKDIQKLRAFPFQVSPDRAKSWIAQVLWMFLSSSETGIQFLEMESLKLFVAAYFPAWIISADLEVDMVYKQQKWDSTSVLFRNCYIPGSHTPMLSAVSLWSSLDRTYKSRFMRKALEPPPFDQSMLRQYDEDVHCIPFTVSPFSILDLAKSTDYLKYNNALSVFPSSTKVNLLSASPILLPLYLARYEVPDRKIPPVNVFIQAHSRSRTDLTVMIESRNIRNLYQPLATSAKLKRFFEPKPEDWDKEVVRLPSFKDDEARVYGVVPKLQAVDFNQGSPDSNFELLDNMLSSSSNIHILASRRNLKSDLNDPRIREMTRGESDVLDRYFDVREKRLSPETLRSDSAWASLRTLLPFRDEKSIDLEAEEKKAIPPWWTEYQLASRLPKSRKGN